MIGFEYIMKLVLAVIFVTILVVGLILASIASFRDRRAHADRRRRLQSRPLLAVGEWYQLYYAPNGIVFDLAKQAASRLARRLQCDMTQLYPTDTFANQLGLSNLWQIQIDADDAMICFNEVDLKELLNEAATPEHLALVRGSKTFGELLRRVADARLGESDDARPA